MRTPHGPEDDPIVEFLVGRFAPGEGTPPGRACPDENLLAGLLEARLLAPERDSIEAHLEGCGTCRDSVAALAREGVGAAPAARSERAPLWTRTWLWEHRAAAAAVLVVALGTALLLRGVRRGPEAAERLLFASARDLAREEPALFEGFRPLSRDERLAPNPNLERGGFAVLYPAGKILETRPSFRWEPAPGVSEQEIALLTGDARLLWARRSAAPPFGYPSDEGDLNPGERYLWRVTAEGPLGKLESLRAFEVASPVDRIAFEAAIERIGRRAPPSIRGLLQAHYALRKDFYGEAEKAATTHLQAQPGDPLARETLYQTLVRLGSSDAGGLGINLPERGRR